MGRDTHLEGQAARRRRAPARAGEAQAGAGRRHLSGVEADGCFERVAPYPFYFVTKFGARYGVAAQRKDLVPVPAGAKEPKIVQRRWPNGGVRCASSPRAFDGPRR